MARLSDGDRAILEAFHDVDPENEYQHNYWSPQLLAALEKHDVRTFGLAGELQRLVRRGLLEAEGRGRTRQFWLSEEGARALDEAQAATS